MNPAHSGPVNRPCDFSMALRARPQVALGQSSPRRASLMALANAASSWRSTWRSLCLPFSSKVKTTAGPSRMVYLVSTVPTS